MQFPYYIFLFNADRTMLQGNPDAEDPGTSDSKGADAWAEAELSMNSVELADFGARYAAAWCSQNAASVAACFEEQGFLQVNAGPPSVGRTAITATAQSFMTLFPDMIVLMDDVREVEGGAVFRWTLVGTDTGPDSTGNRIGISGHEEWKFGESGLVRESKGHFNEADYQQQLGKK